MKFNARIGLKRRVVLGLAVTTSALSAMVFLTPRGPSVLATARPARESAQDLHRQPPWVYGRRDARFTISEYSDLTCPYCAEYFPKLRRWIDDHPDANWQWHHFPLSAHDPEATRSARWVECVGETQGNAAFWAAVGAIYALSADAYAKRQPPPRSDRTSALATCLQSARPDSVIREQVAQAHSHGVTATPTLVVRDQRSGKSIALRGAAEGDVLLSAIDFLVSSSS